MSSVDRREDLGTIETVDVGEIGEWGLVDLIRKKLELPPSDSVLVDIGDDAAGVRLKGLSLLTIDSYLEGVHFDLMHYSHSDIGYKSLAASTSDVAAMGGRPKFALVSLQLPVRSTVEDVAALYSGMIEIASRFDFRIVGGDTIRSKEVGVTCAIVGEAQTPIERKGARADDAILVTGNLGTSSLGLFLMNQTPTPAPDSHFIQAHKRPVPRIDEGLVLSESGVVTAMIDVSDGLSTDIHHLTEESRVGAVIWSESLPFADGFDQIAGEYGVTPLDFALYGGEDYELLFTVPEAAKPRVVEGVRAATGTKITQIGTIISESTVLLERDGEKSPLPRRGFDHFAGPAH